MSRYFCTVPLTCYIVRVLPDSDLDLPSVAGGPTGEGQPHARGFCLQGDWLLFFYLIKITTIYLTLCAFIKVRSADPEGTVH